MDGVEDLRRPDLRQLTKTKIMGRLAKFGRKDKEQECRTSNEQDVSNFLHGGSDKLRMTGTTPILAIQPPKLDIARAKRWPSASEVISTQTLPFHPARRNKKGMNVSFSNRWPEIIGYGGEESEEPSIYIARARDPAESRNDDDGQHEPRRPQSSNFTVQSSLPQRLRGAPNCHDGKTLSNAGKDQEQQILHPQGDLPGEGSFNAFGTPKSQSDQILLTARAKAEMRASEGRTLANAMRKANGAMESSESLETLESAEIGESGKSTVNMCADSIPSPVSPLSPVSSMSRRSSIISVSNGDHLVTFAQSTGQSSPGLLQLQSGSDNHSPRSLVSRTNAREQRARSNSEQSAMTSGSTAAENENDQALDDFAYRVRHFYRIFRLSAESVKPLHQTTFSELVRLASWWFLRGRATIEEVARSRPSSANGNNQPHKRMLKEQGHADIAKALWIVFELIPNSQHIAHDHVAELLADARQRCDRALVDDLEQFRGLKSHLRKLITSMQRNQFLPPTPDEAPLSSGIDNAIWVPIVGIKPDICPLLCSYGCDVHGSPSKITSVALAMPLADSSQVFTYSRIFVDLFVVGDGMASGQEPARCLLSSTRACNERSLTLFLSSQGGLVDLRIQSDAGGGLTWKDVQWRRDRAALDLKLPRGYMARVQMSPQDFSALWHLYDDTSKISSILHPCEEEKILHDGVLKSFQYFDDDQVSRESFPRTPVDNCYVRLLERITTQTTGAGIRRMHRGYRLAIMTGPYTKHLGGISRELVTSQPIRYEFMRGPTGDPTFTIVFPADHNKTRFALAFISDVDRTKFHHLLIGALAYDEAVIGSGSLDSFTICHAASCAPVDRSITALFRQSTFQIINSTQSGENDLESAKVIRSEDLRILIASPQGTITDRVNINTSEILIRLPPAMTDLSLTVHRLPQHDMTIALADSRLPKESEAHLSSFFATVTANPSLRTFTFPTLNDLHSFQSAITGHSILFDDNCTSLSISRRRMVVPIMKKWEAASPRIQIVRQHASVQLVAFFDDWSKGDSMNFRLKSTDSYEIVNRSAFGKKAFEVKFVDAKFSLPKGGERDDDGHRVDRAAGDAFYWAGGVSFDSVEYPTEHDDITFEFAGDAGMSLLHWLG